MSGERETIRFRSNENGELLKPAGERMVAQLHLWGGDSRNRLAVTILENDHLHDQPVMLATVVFDDGHGILAVELHAPVVIAGETYEMAEEEEARRLAVEVIEGEDLPQLTELLRYVDSRTHVGMCLGLLELERASYERAAARLAEAEAELKAGESSLSAASRHLLEG